MVTGEGCPEKLGKEAVANAEAEAGALVNAEAEAGALTNAVSEAGALPSAEEQDPLARDEHHPRWRSGLRRRRTHAIWKMKTRGSGTCKLFGIRNSTSGHLKNS